ncbi:MAG: acyl-CoA dehydrogenase family protein [Deltaproteobacteria bacterium]|nr:acyl-CoA dehydrogenase family protein [Deltaproteobacteria bacterium]
MDFEYNEEQTILKDTLRKFMDKEIIPLANEYEAERTQITKKIIKKLEPFGYVGATVPEEFGGFDLDTVSYCIMVEELGRAWGGLRTMMTVSNLVTTIIYQFGTEEQKKRLLPPLISLDYMAAFALTEPNAGSDAGSVETTAVRDGDDYILNGTKTLITNGSIADVVCVFASVDRSKKAKGITAFLVEKEKSKYSTSKILKMGMHSSVFSEVVFEDCRVPASSILGEEGKGLKVALNGLNVGRCIVAFAVIGLAQASLDAAVRYAKERTQFGKPIGQFQLIQEKIVDMAMELDAARLLANRAAFMIDKGVNCIKEASFAKLYATEAALRIADKAIQVHGGYGYCQEYLVERYYRDARHLTMAEGSSEIQRLIIGREILGLSAII